jgi:hypothetical protein
VSDDASLFESGLRALDAGERPPSPAARSLAGDSPQLRAQLHLVASLRAVRVPAEEVAHARASVDAIILAGLAEPQASPVPRAQPQSVAATRTGRQAGRTIIRWARAGGLAAAILLVCGLLGWQLSQAAAAALPESPLYGLKRLDERVALATAWSDQRRGLVLASIADHRLAELLAEASQQHTPVLRSLAVDLDSTMRELIALTANMAARHEDTRSVAQALVDELDAQATALAAARQSHSVALAAVLNVTVQSEAHAIQAYQLSLPSGGAATPAASATPTAGGSGAAQQPATPAGAHGNSKGSGSQSGHASGGSGNAGNQDKSQQGGISPAGHRPGADSGAGSPATLVVDMGGAETESDP